jgi:F-type H+-transporting ATPase subunit a
MFRSFRRAFSVLAIASCCMTSALPALAETAAAGHGEGARAGHAEIFSWMSLFVGPENQIALKNWLADNVAGTTFIEKADYRTAGHLSHVFMAFVALLIVLATAIAARRALARDADAGVLPSRKIGPLLVFEIVVGSVWNLMKDMMGADEARRHFPIVATLAVYIFAMNILALIPGGLPPTDNLNTNVVMALTVFLATHISGIRVQGPIGYLKHFAGPIVALAPLMIVIEIISHLVRPVSLSLRLLGNMTGDHKVMEIFLGFQVPLLPLPVMFLGLLVATVQTLVFVLLSTVYLSMATAHHDHGDEAHDHH